MADGPTTVLSTALPANCMNVNFDNIEERGWWVVHRVRPSMKHRQGSTSCKWDIRHWRSKIKADYNDHFPISTPSLVTFTLTQSAYGVTCLNIRFGCRNYTQMILHLHGTRNLPLNRTWVTWIRMTSRRISLRSTFIPTSTPLWDYMFSRRRVWRRHLSGI
jgi:hypothetical protein